MPEPVLSIFGKEEGINKPGKPCNEPGPLRNADPDAPLGQGMGRARQGAKVVRRGTDARTDGLNRASKKHALLRSGNMLFGSGILLQRMMHGAC